MSAGSAEGLQTADLAALLEAVPDAMVLTDASGRIRVANSLAHTLFGYQPGELVGRPVDDLLPDELRAKHRRDRAIYAAHSRDLGAGRRLAGRRADGAPISVEVSLAPFDSSLGQLTAATIRDASIQIREARLFRELLEAAPDGMVIVDDQGTIVLVNAQTEALFGYRRSQLIGRPVELLVPEHLAPVHAVYRAGYRVGRRNGPQGRTGDLLARRRDGSIFPVEILLAPLETDEGRLVCAAVRDVTERRRIESESSRVKDEFFAMVSHELRTPLTSMLGYSELMADLEPLSPQGRQFLSVITRSAQRELRLVDDLLTLVAVEDHGLRLNTVRLSLQELTAQVVKDAGPQAVAAAIDLSLTVHLTPLWVDADPDRISQALENLLSNAVKFTPAGGAVSVAVAQVGDRAVVDVADSGTGIDEQDPERVFERLYRTGRAVAEQVPGAGLGLTIARAMATAHGGDVIVHRSDSSGTTFRLWLPLAE